MLIIYIFLKHNKKNVYSLVLYCKINIIFNSNYLVKSFYKHLNKNLNYGTF